MKQREGRMEKDSVVAISQVTCDHDKQRHYTQTRFDILNGFEAGFNEMHQLPQGFGFSGEKAELTV